MAVIVLASSSPCACGEENNTIFPSPTVTFPLRPKKAAMGGDGEEESSAIGSGSGAVCYCSDADDDEEVSSSSSSSRSARYRDSQKSRRSVSFSSVQVREYDLCLGDNPSVANGAPVSLDWNYRSEESYPLEDYELDRFFGSSEQAFVNDRSPWERFRLLRQLGYSRDEIGEASVTARAIREQRLQTIRQVERVDAVRSVLDKLQVPPPAVVVRFRRRFRRRRRRRRKQQDDDDDDEPAAATSRSNDPSSSSAAATTTTAEEEEVEVETKKTNHHHSLWRRRRRQYSLSSVLPTTSADNEKGGEGFPKAA